MRQLDLSSNGRMHFRRIRWTDDWNKCKRCKPDGKTLTRSLGRVRTCDRRDVLGVTERERARAGHDDLMRVRALANSTREGAEEKWRAQRENGCFVATRGTNAFSIVSCCFCSLKYKIGFLPTSSHPLAVRGQGLASVSYCFTLDRTDIILADIHH